VLAGDFTPYFSIALSRKDVGLALGLADRLGVPMPVTSAVRQIYQTATACGMEQLDMAAVTRLYEQWAGVQVRATGSARSA
jgi:3-hydroxyisobutyrate dehydrogenase-like beta-hydroxyacid dehydrogenase